jgi:PAS domain S-box-containing protein
MKNPEKPGRLSRKGNRVEKVTAPDAGSWKQTEVLENLADSGQIRDLHHLVTLGILHLDPDGNITQANPAISHLFNLPIHDLTGRPFINPKYRYFAENGSEIPVDRHPFLVTLRSGKPFHNLTLGLYDTEKKYCRWLLASSYPEFLPGKEKPFQSVCTLIDVSPVQTIVEAFGRYETLLNLAMVASDLGIWKQSFESQSFYLDETTRRHFGLTTDNIQTNDILDRIYPDDINRVKMEALSVIENRTTSPVNTELRVVQPDGSVRWLSINVIIQFLETDSGSVPFTSVGTSQDITERKLANEALQRKTRAFFLLSNCDQALVKINDEKDLLQEICRICVEAGNYLMAWIGYKGTGGDKKIYPQAQYGFEDGFLGSVELTWDDSECGNNPTGTSIRTGQVSIAQNIQQDPRFTCSRDEAIKRGFNSSIALPVIIDKQVTGALTLYSQSPNAFQQDEVDLLSNLINDLSFTVNTIRARARQLQLETELQKSELRYRQAQQAAEVGIWEWDIKKDTLFWSAEMFQVFKKNPDEFIPTFEETVNSIFPEDRKRVTDEIQEFLNAGGPFDIEYRIQDPEGDIHWINIKGTVILDDHLKPSLANGTMQDITQRKKVEEELIQANHKYHLISEYSNDVIWVMDVKTEKFTFISPSIKKLRGYSVEEMMRQTLADVLTPESYQRAKTLLSNSIPDYIEGKTSTSFVLELDQTRKDRSIVSTEVTVSQVYDDQGNLQVIGITREITERKRAEAIIREERNLFQVLMDNIPDAIYFKNLKSQFIRINKAEAGIFGIKDPAQAIGKTDFDIFTEEHARPALEAEEQIIRTGQPLIDFEEKETFPDGHTRWISTSKLPFRNTNGEIIGTFGISHDMTKRKETELALKQRVQEMETVYHLSNFLRSADTVQELLEKLLSETLRTIGCQDGSILLYEPETKKLVLYAAAGWFEQLAGLTLNTDEGLNGHVFSTNTPYLTPNMHDDILLAQKVKDKIPPGQTGGFFPIECREGVIGVFNILMPAPRTFSENELRLMGVILQLAGNAILRSRLTEKLKLSNQSLQEEINQRVSYQSMLAAEKELLSTTVMSLAEGVIITDDEGMIILFNQSAETITGYETYEILNQPLYEVFQILDPISHQIVPDVIQNLIEMTRRQEQDPGYKAPMLIQKSGERIMVSGSIASLKSAEGKSMGHVIVFQDVTERLKVEAQTALSQKMEAIGQMAAGIAHEINTPIQYVGDNLRYLQKAVSRFEEILDAYQQLPVEECQGISPELLDHLAEVKKRTRIAHYLGESSVAVQESLEGVERVRKIVMAMREFSHPSEKEKKLADINHGIETTIAISRNEWKYSAELETDLDPQLPAVVCQIDEINQVILNMIINAVQAIQEKYPPETGEKGKITISTLKFNDYIHIKIKDTGVGIPEEIRQRIFDPFFTTKGVGKGTGQGLSLAHQIIVQKHKGKIYVDSMAGEGTTFTIELPVGEKVQAT